MKISSTKRLLVNREVTRQSLNEGAVLQQPLFLTGVNSILCAVLFVNLEQVIRNASQRIGLNEVILEKDYWVCFVLNYLFSKCKWKDDFTFKGGTSLSKCFNIIQRFSEDIDLILDWRVIGYNLDEPWKERSNTKQDNFNEYFAV